MKLKESRELGAQRLRQVGLPSPQLDADIFLMEVLGLSRVELLTKDDRQLRPSELQAFEELLGRRQQGEPVAYLIGRKSFYGLEFEVGPGVLIPRPETELLVERALEFLQGRASSRVLDVGAGSGAIGLSIAVNCPSVAVNLLEPSSEAQKYLKRNQQALAPRSDVVVWPCAIEDFVAQSQFDLIVMNPPYIDREDPEIQESVARFEPAQALFSDGPFGMAAIRTWLAKARPWLLPGGQILVEHGYRQGVALREWIGDHLPELVVEQGLDLAGLERYLKLTLRA